MVKPKYSEKFFEICFSDKISKQAYLKACKWLAVNVYGKAELSKYASVSINKLTDCSLPTFKVELFITMDEYDMQFEYCKKCKSLHNLMYCVDKPNCETCKLNGYRQFMHNQTESLVKFWKEIFDAEEKI